MENRVTMVTRHYEIKPGRHRPSGWLFGVLLTLFGVRISKFLHNKKREVRVECYVKVDSESFPNDASVHKLFGFGWGLPRWSSRERRFVHANSVRLGYSLDRHGYIVFHVYAYVDGVRSEYRHLSSGLVKKPHGARSSILFTFDYHNTVRIYRGPYMSDLVFCMKPRGLFSWVIYKLGPYYGGRNKAPFRISIRISESWLIGETR